MTLVFLPAHDIATYVGEGNVDMGITGYDVVQVSAHRTPMGKKGRPTQSKAAQLTWCPFRQETDMENNVEVAMNLGFGQCKLCVQAPVSSNITDPSQLAGKRIVTSFPHLTKQYFKPLEKGTPTSKFTSLWLSCRSPLC